MAAPGERAPYQNPDVLETLARPHYLDELEWHNWDHAVFTRNLSRKKATLCLEHDLKVDMDIIESAPLWHDGGFWMTPYTDAGVGADHRFKSKERYAAFLYRQDMMRAGMPPQQIKRGSDAIKSTEKGVACKTLEARILRQSDLANVASKNPYVFLHASYLLFRESQRLQGIELYNPRTRPDKFTRDFLGFTAVSYEILRAYNEEDISLGDFDRDDSGRSLFSVQVAKNLHYLVPGRLATLVTTQLDKIIMPQPIGIYLKSSCFLISC